jgi:transcriptional regulator NrdR family protein
MSKSPKKRYSPKRSRISKARKSFGFEPHVKLLKRDGRIEPFSRLKMIASIRNAGANKREAGLVTDRVSKRLTNRETIPSKEISSMVARSLSRVNSTASRNYVKNRDRKLEYTQRVNHLFNEITTINKQVNGITQRIENLDDRIQSLPTRITQVRKGNYHVLTHLESNQISLSEEWARVNPEIRTDTSHKGETLRARIQDLQQILTSRLGHADYNLGNLNDIKATIPELRLDLSIMQGSIVNKLSSFEKKFQSIDKDLRKAESTVSILSKASFPWEKGETPIIATKAKDLNNDLEGFITLTNLRFIFESKKEIALKKLLFIVTEKKIVREVIIQKPIGMVKRLVQGKVGFFKGAGLFIEFASDSGVPEMKFDTTNQDAKWVTESYNYVISGQVDKDLSTIIPEATSDKVTPKLVICPVCGAPYREKIYRGETSINCKYCETSISLK